SGLRILVAEDNSINQEIARDVLENAGVEVEVAKDGREALDAAHADKFDLILMDVQMPNMDGFEATYRIREDLNESAPPIVAMTAHALEGDQERCMRAGMAGYVSKPIKQEVLYKTIHNVIEKDRKKEASSSLELETAQKKGPEDKSPTRFVPDKSVVDMEAALEDLGVGEEAILRVLGKFRDKYKDVLKDFRSLADSGDWTAFHDLAHSLKGSSGQLRVKLVQEAAYVLERETKTGTVDDAAVKKGLSELDAAINRMVQELKDI
ncbi:MAG: response regulator, partial [Desulfovibrionales bacterium]